MLTKKKKNTNLSNLTTSPVCSKTSQTQAICSCVKPKEFEVADDAAMAASDPTLDPGAELTRLGKPEKLERH